MKPLGFYADVMPGDGSLLDEMQETWGSTFQELNKSEKLWMLSCLLGTIVADATKNYDPYQVGDQITEATERFNELTFYEQMALAEALVNQIRTSHSR